MTKTKYWNPVEFLDSTEARVEYLRSALEDGRSKEQVAVVLLRIAESLGISLLELSLTCLLLTSFETDEVPVTLLEFAKEQLNKKTTEGSEK